jgi:hypothetical protein
MDNGGSERQRQKVCPLRPLRFSLSAQLTGYLII